MEVFIISEPDPVVIKNIFHANSTEHEINNLYYIHPDY